MQSQEGKSSKKRKITLSLDSETIQIIKDYGQETIGSQSVSASVRAMAREYARNKQQEDT